MEIIKSIRLARRKVPPVESATHNHFVVYVEDEQKMQPAIAGTQISAPRKNGCNVYFSKRTKYPSMKPCWLFDKIERLGVL